ncbi:MAG: S8 family peptidase [Eubacteriales bacterium]|nr:S8 family peptidase [Eubacteriales bacterium]
MTECQRRIVSEEYADFLIETGYEEERFQESFPDFCRQDTGYKYGVLYASLEESRPITLERYTYSAIPKLFGLMDTSAAEATGALRLQRRSSVQLTGAGVIVGFVDSGIDYRNPVFQDGSGQTRILALWDQTIQTGRTPEGIAYGSEYTDEDINRALASEDPYDIVPSRDEDGHGTFLAGVACGSEDVERDFTGTANESLICAVKLKPAKRYLRDFYLVEPSDAAVYQENDIILAVTYLLRIARRERKPLVLVLGIGSGSGERAGGSVLSQMLNYFGEMTGNCIVTCCGNEGNERLHFAGDLKGNTYEDVELRVGEQTEGFTMEIWGNVPDILSVAFLAPSGELIPRIPARVGSDVVLNFLLENTRIQISYSLVEGRSGMELIFLRFLDPIPGVWTIRVYGSNVLSGRYNIWMQIRQFVNDGTFFLKPEPDITLDTPAATDSVITVAAYDHVSNALYTDSGRGFTRINTIKPDITAPGVEVYGPGKNQTYVRRSGTSVSAALVAGNCAQLMQWGIVQGNVPQMKTNYIKNFLIFGAQRDRDIAYPSRVWGYGKVDLYETFRILTQV